MIEFLTRARKRKIIFKKMDEYHFVHDPPDDFFCMICAKVLNEPHLTDCCGQHFCGVCLERWFQKQAKKICPHCRSESFTYMRYLPLKRKIDALQMYCPFEIQGCKVVTTVGQVKAHKHECGFARVLCNQGCGATGLRKLLAFHCNNECPKRKVKCQYCGKEDHFEVISGKHVSICEDYPVKCPMGCGQGDPIKRKDLAHHADVCPLVRVLCTFREAGCNKIVLRKDLNSHLESSMQEHLMKMMTSHMELNRKHRELEADHRKLKIEHSDALKSQLKLKEECSHLSSQVRTLTLAEPVWLDREKNYFSFNITSTKGWISPPFYVLNGYKFCIRDERCINGQGSEFCLHLLRGQFDDELEWPINLDQYELEITYHNLSNKSALRQQISANLKCCLYTGENEGQNRGTRIDRVGENDGPSRKLVSSEYTFQCTCPPIPQNFAYGSGYSQLPPPPPLYTKEYGQALHAPWECSITSG